MRIAHRSALLAVTVVAAAGCNSQKPLSVKDPDVATPGTATGAAALPFLRNGALADFAIAVVGAADLANNGHEGVVNMGGIFTDEFLDQDSFSTRKELNDRIALPGNSSLGGVFQNVGAAHNDALRALAQYALYGPKSSGRAEMYNIDAYLYVLVAEHWCSGIPFSALDLVTGNIAYGKPLTTAQMLDTAIAKFAHAQAIASTDPVSAEAADAALQVGLATVGTARAQLDLGQVSQAATTAAAVAPGFSYIINESSNTLKQNNGTWNYTLQSSAFGVADVKNGNGLPFISASDPRVPSANLGAVGTDGSTPFISQQKYPSPTSPMVLGDYTEAQLIVAEGQLFAGNEAGAFATLNALRAAFTGGTLAPLTPSGTPHGDLLQILSERAFWMYVTGHRLGDWRRVLRAPYNAAPFSVAFNDVYASGPQIAPYLEFPLPGGEQPNPNFQACDNTKP